MEAFMQGGYRTIQITFNKSIPEENLPKELKVYVTSEKNTYGILEKLHDFFCIIRTLVSAKDSLLQNNILKLQAHDEKEKRLSILVF